MEYDTTYTSIKVELVEWTDSRSSLKIKVKSQGHQMRKCDFGQFYWTFSDLNGMIRNHGLWCDVRMSYDVTAWRHAVVWRHKTTSFGQKDFKIPNAGGIWTLRRFHSKDIDTFLRMWGSPTSKVIFSKTRRPCRYQSMPIQQIEATPGRYYSPGYYYISVYWQDRGPYWQIWGSTDR